MSATKSMTRGGGGGVHDQDLICTPYTSGDQPAYQSSATAAISPSASFEVA